jgi:hypothetical protein
MTDVYPSRVDTTFSGTNPRRILVERAQGGPFGHDGDLVEGRVLVWCNPVRCARHEVVAVFRCGAR